MVTHIDPRRLLSACLALLVLTPTWMTEARAEEPGSKFRPEMAQLLASKKVQKEFNLTEAQIAAVVDPALKLNFKIVSIGFDPELRKQPDKMKAMLKEYNEKGKELLSHLSSQQQERLQQILYQYAGPKFFQLEDVQKALKLTEGQKQQVTKVVDTFNANLQAQMKEMVRKNKERGGGLAPKAVREANRKKSDLLLEETDKAFNQILTKEQREQVAQMRGKPFAALRQ